MNMMNKLLILLVAFSCTLGVNAQSKKEWKKKIENLEKEKKELQDSLQTLQNSNNRIKNRAFVTTEQSLRIELASYKDVEELATQNIFEKTSTYENLPLAKSYIAIISMYKSLSEDGGYNQKENEAFQRELDSIEKQVQSIKHKDSFLMSFDELANNIRDYRYAMSELARLFVLVDKKEKGGMKTAKIYSSLQDDYETDAIDRIPFTKSQLEKYIEAKGEDRNRNKKAE